MPPNGRPPVLDDYKRRDILALLTVGCSRRAAARYVGCATSTIRNTADRDPDFAAQLRHAEQIGEINSLNSIQYATKTKKDWRAGAWFLERRNREEFASRPTDLLSNAQVHELLTRLAQMLVEELPVARYRQAVLRRLKDLVKRFVSPAAQPEVPEDGR
jgi:hypothetical protein